MQSKQSYYLSKLLLANLLLIGVVGCNSGNMTTSPASNKQSANKSVVADPHDPYALNFQDSSQRESHVLSNDILKLDLSEGHKIGVDKSSFLAYLEKDANYVSGPTEIGRWAQYWDNSREDSRFVIKVIEKNTGQVYNLKIKAQLPTSLCGNFIMNSGSRCSGRYISQLNLQILPADNFALPAGEYEGTFNLISKGWHACYNHNDCSTQKTSILVKWRKDWETTSLVSTDKKINFEFKDGIPSVYGKLDDEVINFTDVKVVKLAGTNCFSLTNKTPRSFRKLTVAFDGQTKGTVEFIDKFTTYTYCPTNNNFSYTSLEIESLPNPYFNPKINGFWSDTNPKYSYFTKEQKQQLTRALVEMRYMLNRDEYTQKLATRIKSEQDAQEIVDSFRNTTKTLRPFMLTCCSEGIAAVSGDWFAIHVWRYNDDAQNPMSIALHEPLVHEISHNLGYRDGNGYGKDAYAIGYAARDVMKEYYNSRTIEKHKPIYE